MFKKKYILILLILIASICAISSVSAADNATDVADAIAADTNAVDIVAADESADEISTNSEDNLEKSVNESNDNEIIATPQDYSQLTQDQTTDELSISFYNLPASNQYKLTFMYGLYNLQGSHNVKDIRVYIQSDITPDVYNNPYVNNYDFSLLVYDSMTKDGNTYHVGNKIYDSGRIYGTDIKEKTLYHINIPANTFKAGTYYLAMINTRDDVVMATSKINVKDNAVIAANDYNAFYNSGAKMTIKLTDSKTGKPLKGTIKATFSNGVVKYYTTDKNGQFSFVPPFTAGKYTVTFAPAHEFLTANSIKKTVNIKKSKVVIKAKKVSEYKGFKITLKATVKSNGKNVKEGKVLFKIKGKKYYVKVKNGVATKKIKLYKVMKYRYSATYLGTKNFYKTKKYVSKAIMYKRYAVKIYTPNPSVYTGQKKTCIIKVKTTDGKKVKNGWLKFQQRNGKYEKVKVKNGKVKVLAAGLLSDVYVKSVGDDSIYKKSVTKKFKIKYVPGSHKYKYSSTKYKGTTKFKCHCGKTYTHSHSYLDYYYFVHYYTIYVI